MGKLYPYYGKHVDTFTHTMCKSQFKSPIVWVTFKHFSHSMGKLETSSSHVMGRGSHSMAVLPIAWDDFTHSMGIK